MKKKHSLHAFIKALDHFHTDVLEMKKFKNDKRMTFQEKKILSCWLFLREGKNQQIMDMLLNMIPENDLVEAQKYLILGLAYNNQTQFNLAIKNLEDSIKGLKEYSLENNLFTAYYTLFVAHLNSKNTDGMSHSLQELSCFSWYDDCRKILVHQCEFNFLSFQSKLIEAEKKLAQLNSYQEKMNESMLLVHLISSFYFYVKVKQFNQCKKILDELKHKRAFACGANYKYMKYLLIHLLERKPIYAYERDFKGLPYLYNQIMVIQSLESNQIDQSKIYWEKLQSSYPDIYQDTFHYTGEVTLFSLCLEKLRPRLNTQPIETNHLNKERAILMVLKNSPNWISKDGLYEKIWGQPCIDKMEMNRLQKYVSKLREKGYNIKYRKGAYLLVQEKLKRSA